MRFFSIVSFILYFTVFSAASCALEQAVECEQYIECDQYYRSLFGISEQDNSKIEKSYGISGLCWQNESQAAECRETCLSALSARRNSLVIAQKELGKCAEKL